uniref:DMT family transporter n=1 Tax=Paenibacillus silvestris TaxID=2606219 RepID=UPI002E29D10C|nr:EamA family transporter [Paenibacillus silvestris]
MLLGGAKSLKQLTRQQVKEIALGGLGLTGIQFGAVYWAEQYLSSGTVAILAGTSPIFTTLLAMWSGQKKRSLHLMIGIVLGFLGTYLVATGTSHETSNGGQKLAYVGIALVLCVKFIYALALTRFQKHTRAVPSMTSNGLQMVIGGLFLLLLSLCFEHVTPSKYSPAAFGALVYLIIFGSVVGYSIFYWLLRVTNAVFPTTFTFVSPVIAMYVGVLFMNEELTLAMEIGAGSVISSVVFLNWGLRKKSKRQQIDMIKSAR